MIDSGLSQSDQHGTVAAYEELRGHILAGSPGGRPLGLLLLLREGIAAWIERRAACPSPPAQSPCSNHAVPGSLPCGWFQAEFVRVLAGIALNGREGIGP